MPIVLVTTCEFFAASIEVLGAEEVGRLWGVKARQAYRFRGDPEHCNDRCDDPLLRLRRQLKRLKEKGRRDLVEGGLRLLAEPVGYSVKCNEVCTDKESALREILDVNREVGKLAECLLECARDGELTGAEKAAVFRRADEAIRQLEELKDAVSKGMR